MSLIFSTPHTYAVFVCYQHHGDMSLDESWLCSRFSTLPSPFPLALWLHLFLICPSEGAFAQAGTTCSIPAGSPSTVLSGNGWKTRDNCRIWFMSRTRAALWLGSRVPITEHLLYKKKRRCISCLLQQERCPHDCTTIAWVRLQGVEASVLWVVLLFQ